MKGDNSVISLSFMKRILSLKHWHLFLLIVVTGAWISPSPLKEIVSATSYISFSVWVYALGVFGNQKISEMGILPFSLNFFKITAFIAPILCVILLFLAPKQVNGVVEEVDLQLAAFIAGGFFLIFVLIYNVVFACKTLTTLELRRQASFSESLTNLVLMIFLFIGIWILQPKITRLIAESDNPEFD